MIWHEFQILLECRLISIALLELLFIYTFQSWFVFKSNLYISCSFETRIDNQFNILLIANWFQTIAIYIQFTFNCNHCKWFSISKTRMSMNSNCFLNLNLIYIIKISNKPQFSIINKKTSIVWKSKNILIDRDTLTHWHIDTLTHWHIDILSYCHIHILTYWHIDILTYWHIDICNHKMQNQSVMWYFKE
jgi:hypothetical protein